MMVNYNDMLAEFQHVLYLSDIFSWASWFNVLTDQNDAVVMVILLKLLIGKPKNAADFFFLFIKVYRYLLD